MKKIRDERQEVSQSERVELGGWNKTLDVVELVRRSFFLKPSVGLCARHLDHFQIWSVVHKQLRGGFNKGTPGIPGLPLIAKKRKSISSSIC